MAEWIQSGEDRRGRTEGLDNRRHRVRGREDSRFTRMCTGDTWVTNEVFSRIWKPRRVKENEECDESDICGG